MNDHSYENLLTMEQMPDAIAYIRGVGDTQSVQGVVTFRETPGSVLIAADVCGLPHNETADIFALHIHEGGACTGTEEDPLADTGAHLNPGGAPHPFHAGDLPPLFAQDGCAWMAVLTGRVKLSDILEKTIVIHSRADDFTSQPAGNPGSKIACGVIHDNRSR